MSSVGLDCISTGKPLDPYLVWAMATDFRDYLPAKETSRFVAVAIECEGTVDKFIQKLLTTSLRVLVPGFYEERSAVPKGATFCTAVVHIDDICPLMAMVKRMELGTAVFPQITLFPSNAALTNERSNAETVIGLIDDFVGFADARFSKADGTSRMRYVWSQDPERPGPSKSKLWRPLRRMGYGFELSANSHAPTKLREAYPLAMRRQTHGAAVADLAAGRGLADYPNFERVDIVAVHMPKRTIADSSGGSLNVQALDGIRYILHRSRNDACIVINLSYGTMAGPHDGTSILEAAMDELIGERKGQLSIVLPAGNAYEARCHALIQFTPRRRSKRLCWQILPDGWTPSFLEIWLPGDAHKHVEIKVVDPAGSSLSVALAPGVAFEHGSGLTASFGVIYLDRVANGDHGTMILVAVAATASLKKGAVVARHGIWSVDLVHRHPVGNVEVHAWIERDDSVHGQPRRGRQSYFVDESYEPYGNTPYQPGDNLDAYVKRAGSFNTIATGESTMVVGGYGRSAAVAAYSGSGPTRSLRLRQGPEILARSEDSLELHGRRAAALGAVDTVRVNGTSVSAPALTAQIADWMQSFGALVPADLRDGIALLGAHGPKPPGKPMPTNWEREGWGRM